MNIALEGTEEWVNGVKTNSYGDAFVRGNNGQSSFPRRARTRLCSRPATVLIALSGTSSVVHFEDGLILTFPPFPERVSPRVETDTERSLRRGVKDT